jgi:hypothetical protein
MGQDPTIWVVVELVVRPTTKPMGQKPLAAIAASASWSIISTKYSLPHVFLGKTLFIIPFLNYLRN